MLKTTHTLLAIVFIFLAAFLAYRNHFYNAFQFDDSHTVVDNPYIRDIKNIPTFFTQGSTFSTLPDHHEYRPLLSTTLAIDYAWAGKLNPYYFHITSFACFLVCVLLIFTVLVKHGVSHLPATLATTFFAVHPAIADTVNYIIQRGEILATIFILMAHLLYTHFISRPLRFAAVIPFILAMLSKQTALVFPILVGAYAVSFGAGTPMTRIKKGCVESLPFLLLGVLFFFTAKTIGHDYKAAISTADYARTQPYVILLYITNFLTPFKLTADTDLEIIRSILDLKFVLPFLAIISPLLIGLKLALQERARLATFGIAWFFITLLPTSSFYALDEVMNSHRMFLPFIGATMVLSYLLSKLNNKFAWIFIALLLIPYGAATFERNKVWRTEESFWQDVVLKSPRNGRGRMNYGLALMSRGDYEGAEREFLAALEFTPNYSNLHVNLGVLYGAVEEKGLAEEHFLRALTLQRSNQTRYYYGRWLLNVGRTAEAANILNESYAQSTKNTQDLRTVILLTQAKYMLGEFTECKEIATALLDIFSTSAELYNNLSACENSMANFSEGKTAAENALKLNPNFELAKNNLAYAIKNKP